MSKRAIAVVVAGSLFMALGWYFMVWGPENNSYASANKKLSSIVTQNQALQAKVSKLSKLNETELSAEVAEFSKAIPEAADLDVFLHQLQDESTASGIVLSSVAPTPASTPNPTATGGPVATGVSEIKLTMSVVGSYEQISAFLDALDGLDRLVITDSIQLVADGSDPNAISGQLSSRIFTRALPAASSSDATPGVK